MNKIINDIENILVELTDNNILFNIRSTGVNITIDFQNSSSLFIVRDQIKEYIQDIFIMLDDYCKENYLDIKVIYNTKKSGKEYMNY